MLGGRENPCWTSCCEPMPRDIAPWQTRPGPRAPGITDPPLHVGTIPTTERAPPCLVRRGRETERRAGAPPFLIFFVTVRLKPHDRNRLHIRATRYRTGVRRARGRSGG